MNTEIRMRQQKTRNSKDGQQTTQQLREKNTIPFQTYSSRVTAPSFPAARASCDSQTTSTENNTKVTEFILLGLPNAPELQIPLFIMFTLIYLIIVVGNLRIMVLILLDSRLHTPMYFFFSDLSLVDFSYSTAVTPKVMAGLLIGDKVISYHACAAQMFFFAVFATVESYLLASVAYDRYAAVCQPLYYIITMTTGVCACLAIGCYVCGFPNASVNVGDTSHLAFCKSNVIHYFFCDVPAVMALSCSDKHVSELVLVFAASFHIVFALLVILISYMFNFITILKMSSVKGYQKAISTCASHLTAVSIFYGIVIFLYSQLSSSHSMDTDKTISVFWTMVIPMLNPVVYSLRNKEVKNAFKKVVEKAKLSLIFTS
ncbi:PREDICTED: olfactory receptor 5B2-like [Odobenus rosmarus divergens]|uniref:Olfactory receptor n=1 Tax=Odobenus rosmarus divergens TaxID=9708 RepID=A0A2U3WKG2_ODORO|nr:PREDICTED: olfactory receptor 5B2-like [Odobenus rosmarus divergens]